MEKPAIWLGSGLDIGLSLPGSRPRVQLVDFEVRFAHDIPEEFLSLLGGLDWVERVRLPKRRDRKRLQLIIRVPDMTHALGDGRRETMVAFLRQQLERTS